LAGHVARTQEMTGVYSVWWENWRERDNFEEQGLDGTIILKWMFMK